MNSISSIEDFFDYDIYMDVCWKKVINDVCSEFLCGYCIIYMECCCQDGEVWSQQCVLCFFRSFEVYVQLCNVVCIEVEWEVGVYFWLGYEYGFGFDDLYYSIYGLDGVFFYNYLGFEDIVFEFVFFNIVGYLGDCIFIFEFFLQFLEFQFYYVVSYLEVLVGFEGFQVEECGILNGCENGCCVCVWEGYICDCFEGFQLDVVYMVCVDVNECDDLNGFVVFCVYGYCENIEGFYCCYCFLGYVVEVGFLYCIVKEQQLVVSVVIIWKWFLVIGRGFEDDFLVGKIL